MAQDYSDIPTGSVVLFGSQVWSSRLIRWGTRCPFSHTGIVVQAKLKDGRTMPCIYESTSRSHTLVDIVTGHPKSGPNLSPMHVRLNHITCDNISIRRFYSPQEVQVRTQAAVARMVWKHHHKQFEKNKFNMVLAAFGLNKEDKSSFFCSEFCMTFLEEAGLLRDDCAPTSDYIPRAFMPNAQITQRIPTLDNAVVPYVRYGAIERLL